MINPFLFVRNLFSKKSDDKIVIFIHGLENKPPKKLLKKWYLKAIREGFIKHLSDNAHFEFEVVYWADLLYTKALDPNVKIKDHPLFLDEPYIESNRDSTTTKYLVQKKRIYDRLERFVDGFFLSKKSWVNVEYIFDQVASRAFKDLHAYYRKNVRVDLKSEEKAKKVIRTRLKQTLKLHQDKEIFLIAHSMGSIIAYDVLSNAVEEVSVHSLLTIGSPLGLSMIKREIFKELQSTYDADAKLPTPNNIKSAWFNFADIDDNVAINYNLSDDYAPNVNGVAPIDKIVTNDYEIYGEKNPHKSYGYLRTREVAQHLFEFVKEKEKTLEQKFKDLRDEVFKSKNL